MKTRWIPESNVAIAIVLSIFLAGDAFARGGRGGGGGGGGGGGRSVSRSGSYGSVRQSSYRSSRSVDRGDGEASWERDVTGSGGRTAEISGEATLDDGELNVSREATGSEGRTASRETTAERDGAHVDVTRETTVTGERGSYSRVQTGTIVTTLPADRIIIRVGGAPYYYYGGCYYESTDDDEYTVVDPPIGAVIYELPDGAIEVTVGGVRYYADGNVFYRPTYVNGQVAYTVVSPPKAG